MPPIPPRGLQPKRGLNAQPVSIEILKKYPNIKTPEDLQKKAIELGYDEAKVLPKGLFDKMKQLASRGRVKEHVHFMDGKVVVISEG